MRRAASAGAGLSAGGDGSRPEVAPGDQLGDDADGDLGDGLRADVEPDRRRRPGQALLGDPLLAQALEDQPDLPPAADQADVRGAAVGARCWSASWSWPWPRVTIRA